MVGDQLESLYCSFVFFSFAGQMSWQVDPIFFGWLSALACGSGLFGQLILIVIALLVIIAGSSVCPVV